MVRLFACFIELFISSGAHAAERLVGLVEVPAMHSHLPGDPPAAVPLFAEPSMQSEVAVVVHEWKHLDSREVDYETVAAVVYEYKVTSGVWFKLRYSDGQKSLYGWLSGANAGKFSWYFQAVRARMTYFTPAWDKRLYQHATVKAPSQQYLQLGDRAGVSVAGVRGIGKDLWFLVVILEKNNCAFDDEGTTIIATGWVPAYAESGEETIWYYARGC